MINLQQGLSRCLLIVLFLMLVPTAQAIGDGVEQQGNGRYKVVFINPGYADKGFWQKVTATMSAAADQLGFDLEVYYSERQWLKMVRNAEAAINTPDKPDFLILVNEYQEGARLLALADKAGIPTFMLLNSLTPKQREAYSAPGRKMKYWIASLTPDNEIAGYEMARSLVTNTDLLQGNDLSSIALLTLAGDNKTPASLARLKGLERALEQFPQLQEQRRIAVNWSEKTAYKRTRIWLESGQPLDAVWAANDAIALGAMSAIREAGLKPGIDVKIAGLNWSQDGIAHVLKGEMVLTHGGHFLAGAWAMVMLYDITQNYGYQGSSNVKGHRGTYREMKNVHFPMTAINQENAEDYLKHFGHQQWSKIPFKAFSLTHSKKHSQYQFTLDKLIQSLRQPLQP